MIKAINYIIDKIKNKYYNPIFDTYRKKKSPIIPLKIESYGLFKLQKNVVFFSLKLFFSKFFSCFY